MRNLSLIRKILSVFGLILIFWGLVMLNVINGINLFEYTNKILSFSVFITGIVCCIAANFFKERKV
ncbi:MULTISPECIES: hypothetical protein [unclassified Bacillus (in: firmicutes)]|uniref:hypothetical protein n=1 Tax=unclassified Bacillus (in: firmicutes) TaxID=185979 RepID=UPI000BF69680|nr:MULTISPECIES: hypothetical protein [unclassified Bacillus (in: firmicutes)]PEU15426.1 hypothetical protein CN525_17410 [Bacillus sp. AFS014408]PFW56252.1 hypothetical protein COL20_26945 [Bacillus sp. AFS075034]